MATVSTTEDCSYLPPTRSLAGLLAAFAAAASPRTALAQEAGTPVQVQMRHTDFHVDSSIVMHETDLMIVDAEPKDPFDFFLDQYNAQLVAGYSRNTKDHGLIVTMPDYRRRLAPDGGRLEAPS